jgi:uncharacterized Zn finger protein (UPF0148 family)
MKIGELFPCQQCGKPTIRKKGVQKYCLDCSYEVQRIRKYQKNQEVIVGEEFACSDCGKIIVRKSGNHVRCDECAARMRIKRQNEENKKKVFTGVYKDVYKVVEKPKYTLAEMNQAARKNGMTYGKYAAALKEGRVEEPEHIVKKKRGRKCKGT